MPGRTRDRSGFFFREFQARTRHVQDKLNALLALLEAEDIYIRKRYWLIVWFQRHQALSIGAVGGLEDKSVVEVYADLRTPEAQCHIVGVQVNGNWCWLAQQCKG